MQHVGVEIITTGSEVLTGEILNSNAAWLGDACTALGLPLIAHTTVGDDAQTIGAACAVAADRARVVIVTGGLGATSDDLTLRAAAQALHRPLEFHEAIWTEIQAWFAKRGRPCDPINRRMAEFPAGARALTNAVGLAYGVQLTLADVTFFFLPGIPKEMERIFVEHIRPWFMTQGLCRVRARRVLRCYGLPEATIGQRLEALALSDVEVGYRVIFPETLVKLIASGDDAAHVAQSLDAAEAIVRADLGPVIYGTGDDTLAAVVGRALTTRGETLACAESCTGGVVSHYLTNSPGASQYFLESIVVYSNAAKVHRLGVDAQVIETQGAVSAEVAIAMATGVRTQAGATYGIGITGIAGPEGGSPAKPVGTAFVALATPHDVQVDAIHYPNDRRVFKRYLAFRALDRLRKELV
jgi:nicotinamide-nucleotide amidase